MKILLIPNKCKGSLDAKEILQPISSGIIEALCGKLGSINLIGDKRVRII